MIKLEHPTWEITNTADWPCPTGAWYTLGTGRHAHTETWNPCVLDWDFKPAPAKGKGRPREQLSQPKLQENPTTELLSESSFLALK